MQFYWVNLGATFKEVLDNKFLWAPLYSKTLKDKDDPSKGMRIKHFSHWDNVADVRKGDVIFCNYSREIQFIAVAKSDSYNADQPKTRAFSEWEARGNKIDVEIVPLQNSISIDGEISDLFSSRFNKGSNPKVITTNGTVFQGYLASIPVGAAMVILKCAGETEQLIINKSDFFAKRPGVSVSQEGSNKPTVRKAIADARIGQGKFRKDLIRYWESCPITNLRNKDLLVASHIQPWAISSDRERLDPFNGLLLAVHIDRLFDKGLISFDDSGKIIISDLLSSQDARTLGINSKLTIPITREHMEYLKKHRELFNF